MSPAGGSCRWNSVGRFCRIGAASTARDFHRDHGISGQLLGDLAAGPRGPACPGRSRHRPAGRIPPIRSARPRPGRPNTVGCTTTASLACRLAEAPCASRSSPRPSATPRLVTRSPARRADRNGSGLDALQPGPASHRRIAFALPTVDEVQSPLQLGHRPDGRREVAREDERRIEANDRDLPAHSSWRLGGNGGGNPCVSTLHGDPVETQAADDGLLSPAA